MADGFESIVGEVPVRAPVLNNIAEGMTEASRSTIGGERNRFLKGAGAVDRESITAALGVAETSGTGGADEKGSKQFTYVIPATAVSSRREVVFECDSRWLSAIISDDEDGSTSTRIEWLSRKSQRKRQ
jgi:hypothetical protein